MSGNYFKVDELESNHCYICIKDNEERKNNNKYMGAFKGQRMASGDATRRDDFAVYEFERGNIYDANARFQRVDDCQEPLPPALNETKQCYDAVVGEDGKLMCPKCKFKEGGTRRIITHKWNCEYNGMDYCNPVVGGRRRRKSTRNRKRRNNLTRRNKRRNNSTRRKRK